MDRRFRIGVGDVAGAVADLGVFVPLVAALLLVNGLDPAGVLIVTGAVIALSGVVFAIPFPVQPLKALTAVAVARQLTPEVIHAAGLLIGVVLLVLSWSSLADRMARLFTTLVVRALQFGVGTLLAVSALRLVTQPPEVFRAVPPSPWPALLGLLTVALVAWGAARRRPALPVVALAAGLVAVLVAAVAQLDANLHLPAWQLPALHLPAWQPPPLAAFGTAFVLLVVPQIPLTFGNAVVAVSDVARSYFGPTAARVTPTRVCRSAGVANVLAAMLGGMPVCHGSGGLTAHYRLGARSPGMNLLLGGAVALLGLVFAPQALAVLGLLPVSVLAAFLGYAGLRHALLVSDLSGPRLGIAVAAGLLGASYGNLAVTAAAAVAAEQLTAVPLFRRAGAPPR